MLTTDFLLTRRSIRSYRDKKLTDKEISSIEEILSDINSAAGDINFNLHIDGERVYESLDGHGGYGGKMIEAPAYISMAILDERPENYLIAAYDMEDIVTKVYNLGFSSCWVTLLEASDDILDGTFKEEGGQIRYLLAIGHPMRSFKFHKTNYIPKIGVEDYVFKAKDEPYTIEELDQLGLGDLFYYLKMAPSSKDKQPWRFFIQDHNIELYCKDVDSLDDYVDIGIVLYYYDNLAKSLSIQTDWDLDLGAKKIDDLTYIGKTRF